MPTPKIAVLVGSLRKESINRKLAHALAAVAQGKLDFQFIDLTEVAMFNQDHERDPAPPTASLRKAIESADGVLLVTPEYNRSIPPVLKNAIDWASRPYGQNKWRGKPGAIAGTSEGAVGTAVGQAHLRTILVTLEVALMGQPELYLVTKPGLIDEDGEIANDQTREFLQGWVDAFAAWVEKHGEG